jgi:hypothetical protein
MNISYLIKPRCKVHTRYEAKYPNHHNENAVSRKSGKTLSSKPTAVKSKCAMISVHTIIS